MVAIKEKRRGKLAAGVLLLHDNAPVHKSRVAQVAARECKFEQLNHPPYTPDLAPSDYYSGDSVFHVHGNACKTLFNGLETQRFDHA